MKLTLKQLKRIIKEEVQRSLDQELETVEVGDLVNVDVDAIGTSNVRVLELLDDVSKHSGLPPGPGFIGREESDDGHYGKGVDMVFSMDQVLPGSKMIGYFPKLGDEFDTDEFGRSIPNPYRKGAKRHANSSISRPGDYSSEDDFR